MILNRPIRTVVMALLLMAVAATGRAGTTTANLGGSVALAQNQWDTTAIVAVSDLQFSFSPIPSGQAVFGALLWEGCNAGNGICATYGYLDHINVGNQQAIILGTVQDPRCQSSSACGAFVSGIGNGGLAITLWWLPNVQGNPTTVDYVSNSGGQFLYDGTVISIFSGIPANATVDAANGISYAPTGAWNGPCCSDGSLTSLLVTPSQPGDFLYGVGSFYGCGPPNVSAGPGWNGSNFSTNYFGKVDEWQVYNSTSPIAATFSTSCGGVTWAATLAIKMQ